MLVACLREILSEKALVLPASDGTISLDERQSQRIVQRLEVTEVPSNTTIIRMNRTGLSIIKQNEVEQVCDFLLVHENENERTAVFVELKRTLDTKLEKGKEQLRRSLPRLEYLRSACEIHCHIPADEAKLEARYWVIAERRSARLDKQPVKLRFASASVQHHNIIIHTYVGKRVSCNLLLDPK